MTGRNVTCRHLLRDCSDDVLDVDITETVKTCLGRRPVAARAGRTLPQGRLGAEVATFGQLKVMRDLEFVAVIPGQRWQLRQRGRRG